MKSIPLSYKALAIKQAGAPISLEQKTVEALQDDEVLIRVHYSSINKMDPMLAVRNIFDLPTPYVLGFDFSGDVVELGGQKDASPSLLKVGQAVFGRAVRGGGYAEYVVTKKEFVLPRGAMPAPEASTLGIAFMTAYESLVMSADISRQKGKWIYIAGAGGGLGHFAVQIAKIFGLKVIGSAGKKATLELLHELKVDHIIDYSKQDVTEEIMKFTKGKGVDLVYDSTNNPASYAQSSAVIARDGEYIRLGTPAQLAQFGLPDVTQVVESRGAKLVIGDAGRYTRDPQFIPERAKLMDGLAQAVKWYEEGKLKPVITGTVPFDAKELQQAFDDFKKGISNAGKVVVKCS